jgi:NitT/TauT family transport system substrate-binding protein
MNMTEQVRHLIGIMAVATVLSVAPSAVPVHAAELTPASLRLKWLPQAQFVGYYVAAAKGWYKDEGIDLKINPGGPNIIAENMVASGADTFGHGGGAASLLQAREKGLSIVGIGMLFQETPYRFVTLEKSAMLRANNIEPRDVKIEAQAASMTPFLEGKVDMAIVTVYNEALVLKRRGVTPAAVFNPADMGVNIPNEALIVNERVIKENPKLVQGFLNATLRGWAYALTHPDEAIDILLAAAPNVDRTEQKEQLHELVPLILYGDAKTKGIGHIDQRQLAYTNRFLVENGVLKSPVDVPAAINSTFWDNVPPDRKIAKGVN